MPGDGTVWPHVKGGGDNELKWRSPKVRSQEVLRLLARTAARSGDRSVSPSRNHESTTAITGVVARVRRAIIPLG